MSSTVRTLRTHLGPPAITVVWYTERDAFELSCHLQVGANRFRYYTSTCWNLNEFFSRWIADTDNTAREIFGYEGWDEPEHSPQPSSRPRTIDELLNL